MWLEEQNPTYIYIDTMYHSISDTHAFCVLSSIKMFLHSISLNSRGPETIIYIVYQSVELLHIVHSKIAQLFDKI